MADQRELILSRLVAACAAVDGVANAVRNRLDVTQLERPAIVIFDGSEHFTDAPPSGAPMQPQIQRMELMPALSIHVRGTDTVDGGGLLSLYRTRVLAAVLSDATLLGYCWQGRIRYSGAAVAPPSAEGREYRIDLSLVFTYTFKLDDILPVGRTDGRLHNGGSERPEANRAFGQAAGNAEESVAAEDHRIDIRALE